MRHAREKNKAKRAAASERRAACTMGTIASMRGGAEEGHDRMRVRMQSNGGLGIESRPRQVDTGGMANHLPKLLY